LYFGIQYSLFLFALFKPGIKGKETKYL
jgi:hypothetical protein